MNRRARITLGCLRCVIVSSAAFGAVLPAVAGAAEPNLSVGAIADVMSWGEVGGVYAYSVGHTACNIGNLAAGFANEPSPAHPVFAGNLYRFQDGRFEQLGQGWVMHGFCALQTAVCSTCSPACGGCCNTLGAGCSSSDTASINGQATVLGPRSEIIPHVGTNQGTHAMPTGDPKLRGRIQVAGADVDPALNPGAVYFVESHVVAADDAQSLGTIGDNNNATHRRVTISGGANFPLSLTGPAFEEQAAFHAWQAQDPEVVIVDVEIPGDGLLKLGYRVTQIDDDSWHYEYALYNMNSDGAVGSFSVPLPNGLALTNIGFHDVNYHSGELYDGTDWPDEQAGGELTWSTDPFATHPNANALRWATLYNFRFDANAAPQAADLTIGLFKSGDSVTVPALAPGIDCDSTIASCCDTDSNNIRDDGCVWCACDGVCTQIPTIFGDVGASFGACQPDGFANLFDRNHVLTCFAGTNPCPAMNIDVGGPFGDCQLDGFCNVFDSVHVLTSFAQTSSCSCPQNPAPQAEPREAGRTVLTAVAESSELRPGGRVAVRLLVSRPVANLNAYQLQLAVSGGTSGQLQLADIRIEEQPGFVFAGAAGRYEASNVAASRMLCGLDSGGVATGRGGYLATFTYAATADAAGTFVIDVEQDGAQTALITADMARIGLESEPATVRVIPAESTGRVK